MPGQLYNAFIPQWLEIRNDQQAGKKKSLWPKSFDFLLWFG